VLIVNDGGIAAERHPRADRGKQAEHRDAREILGDAHSRSMLVR